MVTRRIVLLIFDSPQTCTTRLFRRCMTSPMNCAREDSYYSAVEDILSPTSRGSGPSPSQLLREKNWIIGSQNIGQKGSSSLPERTLRPTFTISLRTTTRRRLAKSIMGLGNLHPNL